jgi:hypothetical protein
MHKALTHIHSPYVYVCAVVYPNLLYLDLHFSFSPAVYYHPLTPSPPPLPYNCNTQIHHIYILIITSALLFSFSFLFAKLLSFSPDLFFVDCSSPNSYTTRLVELFFLARQYFLHISTAWFPSVLLFYFLVFFSSQTGHEKKTLQIRQAITPHINNTIFFIICYCRHLCTNKLEQCLHHCSK